MLVFLAMDAVDVAFWAAAIFGTVLFAVKVILMIIGIGGIDGDMDIDVDADFDTAMDASDAADAASFKLFTIQTFMALMMGFGWVGVTLSWSYPTLAKPIVMGISLVTGLVLAFILGFIMKQVLKLDSEGKYDVRTTVGKVGKVYTRIPQKGEGSGQVELNVQGRRQIVDAVSAVGQIDSFTEVKVIDMANAATVVVEPVV